MNKDTFEPLPELSVVIPAYNACRTIVRALSSLVDQTVYQDCYEIIVVDDGSTDDTWEHCLCFAKKYANIHVIHQSNGGVSSARNRGLLEAKGRWVTFVDSDDYVTQDYISTVLTTAPTAEYVIFDHIRAQNGDIYPGKPWLKQWFNREVNTCQFLQWVCDNRLNAPWDKRFSRSVIQKNSIRFPEDIHMGEDLLFNFEYARCVETAYVSNQKIYCYLDNASSLTHNRMDLKRLAEYEVIYNAMLSNCEEDGYSKTVNLSFLRIAAISAGQMFSTGHSCETIGKLFDESNMIQSVLKERSWNIKDILRKVMLCLRLYGLCAVLCRG